MLDPNLYEDPEIGSLSFGARLLFIGLISNADDEGRGTSDPRQLRKMVFGYDDVTADQVGEWLQEIVSKLSKPDGNGGTTSNVLLYEVDGKSYYWLRNWKVYQTINRPTNSRLPAPFSGNGHHERTEWEAGLDGFQEAHVLVLNAAGLAAVPSGDPQWASRIENVRAVLAKGEHEKEKVAACLKEAREHWVATDRKDKRGKYSILTPGWVDWGLAALTGVKPWENGKAPAQGATGRKLAAIDKSVQKGKQNGDY